MEILLAPALSILGVSIRTFPLLIALGGLIAAYAGWRSLRGTLTLRVYADLCLGALIGGVLLSRAGYALIHGIDGGMNWHGALFGSLIGLAVAARLHRLAAVPLDVFAWAVPILGAAAWSACGFVLTAHCGYGAEIWTLADAPPWAAAESRDVFGLIAPRWNTQIFGLILSLLTLLGLLVLRNRLDGRRFWLAVLLMSAGMFIIDAFRGDVMPRAFGLRVDQALDLIVAGWSIAVQFRHFRHSAHSVRTTS